MTERFENINVIEQDPPTPLSVQDLRNKRFQSRPTQQSKMTQLRLQNSKPPKNAVKLKPEKISVPFKWALVLTILCFFTVGPCWALYKIFTLRRMIRREELEAATHLSSKITSVLIVSTILGIFIWVAILFCSVGLLLTGQLVSSNAI